MNCSTAADAASMVTAVKSLDEVRVLSLRSVLPNYRAQGELWQKLFVFAKTNNVVVTGPTFAINFTPDCRQTDVEVEVCLPIAASAEIAEEAPFTVRVVPAVDRAATGVHVGSCEQLPAAYQKFYSWVGQEKFTLAGPSREVYVQRSSGCSKEEDDNSVTEIQQPIA